MGKRLSTRVGVTGHLIGRSVRLVGRRASKDGLTWDPGSRGRKWVEAASTVRQPNISIVWQRP
jgi:hypothetical protein